MPWNAAGQPITTGKIASKQTHDSNNFWDDVMGMSGGKLNGSNNQRGGHSKKGFK